MYVVCLQCLRETEAKERRNRDRERERQRERGGKAITCSALQGHLNSGPQQEPSRRLVQAHCEDIER